MDPITPAGAGPRGPGSASPAGAAGTVARLRQLIAEGHLARGERLAEEAVAAALGVSRTPVRLAFRTLAQEGLLQRAGKRGHVVRDFSPEDVRAAVEVRGVLEGLAARRLAEQGLPEAVRAELHACLAEGEAVLAGGAVGRAREGHGGRRPGAGAATVAGRLTEAGIARWSALNARFHAAIVQGGGRTHVIADAIARNNHLPFASADSIRVQKDQLGAEWRKLQMAQMQHRLIVEALEQREGARVEALMREHANIGLRYGALFGLQDGIDGAPPAQ
ncbi:MAG: GntR family transcriptional regulator [Rubrivivax sp.]|nr:GntR family transcriptional regulator [Rubrivivax sp.]